MIYYIIAVDPKTSNEWVMPRTTETVTEALDVLAEYKTRDPRFEYRVDTTRPHVFERVKYTAKELFPPNGGKLPTSNCVECGAYVTIPHQVTHAGWHNKIADL